MSAREHILCVDDEPGILNVLRQQLSPFEDRCDIDLASGGAEALELVAQLDGEGEPLAMIIADQIMPGMKGVELLEEVHRLHPESMKILLTGQAGLDAIVYAINHAGLNRYIGKPWDEPDLRITVKSLLQSYRLARENAKLMADLRATNEQLKRLNRELEARVEERTSELAEANQRLAQLAITDGLTGKYNHRYFHERLALEAERSRRNKLPLSLLMIDVDFFKAYNDQYGHPAGDEVLRRVADLLSDGRRANDVVARYGGEEFSVLLLDTPGDAAVTLAEQLRQRVADETFDGEAQQPGGKLTISVGVAECPRDADDPRRLLLAADAALYEAKRKGRDRVESAAPE